MTAETWVSVVGFEGLYEVSELGRVRSLDRIVFTLGRHRVRKGRVLTPVFGRRGYQRVMLTDGLLRNNCSVHLLVLGAFVGPRPEELETRHLNGDPGDNRLENLAYGTIAENAADRVGHKTSAGIRNANCRLSNEDVIAMRAARADGLHALAARFGIDRSHVWRILTNRSWRHL